MQILQKSFSTAGFDSLYLHSPFCFHKCHYCDFYSIVDRAGQDRQPSFIDRLSDELQHWCQHLPHPWQPRTIFFGGGTPTLLAPALLEKLFAHMHALHLLDHCQEFTVEANPETVTPQIARILKQAGVNRVSIGCQSFQPHLLKALERWHDPASVARSLDHLRDAGITNLNLDLIFAIPGQSLADLDADLDSALALQPSHLSYYGLTYEPNTALTQRLKLNQVQRLDESLERTMYDQVMTRLAQANFIQYELSNWHHLHAAPAHHNLAYWHNLNWLGLGPSAASHFAGHRWKNQPHLGQYLASSGQPPIIDYEHLPPQQRTGEILMLRLRLLQGIPLTELHALLPADDTRHATIKHMLDIHMLERTDTHLRLSLQGRFVADSILVQLL